jgi:hypothetical protein
VACEGCLARHHAACWRENGACASCAGTKRLEPTSRRARLARRLAVAAVGVVALAAIAVREVALERRMAELENRTAGATASAGALAAEVDVARVRASEAKVRAGLKAFGANRTLDEVDTIGVHRVRRIESLSGDLVEVASAYQKLGLADDVRRVLEANDALLNKKSGKEILAILDRAAR